MAIARIRERLWIIATTGLLCGACQGQDHQRVAVEQGACFTCHEPDYAATTQPPHPGHFPTTCAACHGQDAWSPALFDHTWPLSGAHGRAACGACHVEPNPVFAGLSRACVSCHQADYDGSPYPGHSAFPTSCESCHGTEGWRPASGGAHPEDRFPIQRGAHSVVQCNDCHNADLGGPTAGMNADCVGCHTGDHTRAAMDREHSDVGRYPSGEAPPNFCLDCHSSGS